VRLAQRAAEALGRARRQDELDPGIVPAIHVFLIGPPIQAS
jgi:hypothetical protein